MEFDWDAAKAKSNYIKHAVTFEFAVRAFLDEHSLVVEDNRKNYGELRFAIFAEIDRRVHVITYAMRENRIRIISARKGNRREQKKYYSVRSRPQQFT